MKSRKRSQRPNMTDFGTSSPISPKRLLPVSYWNFAGALKNWPFWKPVCSGGLPGPHVLLCFSLGPGCIAKSVDLWRGLAGSADGLRLAHFRS
jgi:hypothetical protein